MRISPRLVNLALRALVALAGGFQWLGWFARYSLARPLERARRPMMLFAALRRC